MAAPMGYPQPLNNKVPAMPMQQQRVAIPPYQPPSTPEETTREKERITLLLEINSELLKHTLSLQAQGFGSLSGLQLQPGDQAADPKTASEEYRECMRHLSYNIGYLHAAAQMVRNKPGTLAGPAMMDAPECLPSLAEPYQRLKKLFPGWKGVSNYSAQRHPSGSMPQGQSALPQNQGGVVPGQLGAQFSHGHQYPPGQYTQNHMPQPG